MAFDYITPIKDELTQNMHQFANTYKLIGMSKSESPRWFNFRGFDHETKVLSVGSTQRQGLMFEVQTDFIEVVVNDFWEQFKAFRTEFLKEHHPTIETF